MARKIPLVLWIYQFIVALVVIATSYILYRFIDALSSSFTMYNSVGLLINLLVLTASIVTVFGIWRKASSARLGVLIYSYTLFLFSVFIFVTACLFYTPADLQTQYRITNIVIYTIMAVGFLSLPVSIQMSEKVRAYFIVK